MEGLIQKKIHPDFLRIMNNMMRQYGKEKGKQVFHAWVNEHGFDDTMSMEGQKEKLKKADKSQVIEERKLGRKDLPSELEGLSSKVEEAGYEFEGGKGNGDYASATFVNDKKVIDLSYYAARKEFALSANIRFPSEYHSVSGLRIEASALRELVNIIESLEIVEGVEKTALKLGFKKDIEKFTELRRLLTDALTIVDSSLAIYDEEPKDVDEAPANGGHEGNMDETMMGKHDLGSLVRKLREKP